MKQYVELMCESHTPNVCLAMLTASLGNEIDVGAIIAPYGAEVIGSMESELRQLRSVGAAGIQIGVAVGVAAVWACIESARADHKNPLSIGR